LGGCLGACLEGFLLVGVDAEVDCGWEAGEGAGEDGTTVGTHVIRDHDHFDVSLVLVEPVGGAVEVGRGVSGGRVGGIDGGW
jgi:hypothetical protein